MAAPYLTIWGKVENYTTSFDVFVKKQTKNVLSHLRYQALGWGIRANLISNNLTRNKIHITLFSFLFNFGEHVKQKTHSANLKQLYIKKCLHVFEVFDVHSMPEIVYVMRKKSKELRSFDICSTASLHMLFHKTPDNL